MSERAKHTQGDFYVEPFPPRTKRISIAHKHLGAVAFVDNDDVAEGQGEKIANMLVGAVNTHDELVAALVSCRSELEYAAEKLPHTNAKEVLHFVRAALSRAGVK